MDAGARGAPLAKPIVAAAGGRARVRGPGSALTRGFFARLGLASPSAAARLAGFLAAGLAATFLAGGFPSVLTSVFTVTVLLRLGGMVSPLPSPRARFQSPCCTTSCYRFALQSLPACSNPNHSRLIRYCWMSARPHAIGTQLARLRCVPLAMR